MKVEILRKLIREEVRAAVKEDLQDIMNEAVKIASQPVTEKSSVTVTPYVKVEAKPEKVKVGQDPIMSMLEQTRKSMTNEDYRTIINMDSSAVTGSPMAGNVMNQMSRQGAMPGLDISQLGFVNKAKDVLAASNKKDLERKGLA